MVDDRTGFDVLEKLADFAGRVVMIDVYRDSPRLQAADHHLGIAIVVHDQRDAILPTLPVVQPAALLMYAEAVVRQKIRQLPSTYRRRRQRVELSPVPGSP